MKNKLKNLYNIAVEQGKNIAMLLGLFISVIAINGATATYFGKRESKAVERQLELQWRNEVTKILKSVQDTITVFSTDFRSYKEDDIKWKESHEKKEALKEETLKEVINAMPNNKELIRTLKTMERQFNLFTNREFESSMKIENKEEQTNNLDPGFSCVNEIIN